MISKESSLKEYGYLMTGWPFDNDNYPTSNFLRFQEASSEAEGYGILYYSALLTQKQVHNYQLALLLDEQKFAAGKKFIMNSSCYTFYVTILQTTAVSLKIKAIMPDSDFDEEGNYQSNHWMKMVQDGDITEVEEFPLVIS